MSALPTSIIYTQNTTLLKRFSGFLHSRTLLQHVSEPEALDLLLHQNSSSLLFMDLCSPKSLRLIEETRATYSSVLIIALGEARSDPALRAATMDVYTVESPDPGCLRLQTLFDQAQSHQKLQNENRVLREALFAPATPQPEPPRETIVPSLHHFSRAFRRFDNVGEMLESIVEGVASCAKVSRVAVFALTSDEHYTFGAGIKCMEETRELHFSKTHPFVRWIRIHAHSISRSMLRHIEHVEQRILIEQMLDQTGAEVILPLFGRERLNGWLCVGRACSGAPFGLRNIEELTEMAEQVSVAIENSLLHENIALQKAMAENLLQAIPSGIIAIGRDGTVRWFNNGAEQLLGRSASELIGRPVEKVSSAIASMLHRCIDGKEAGEAQEWSEPISQKKMSILTRCLEQAGQCVGAMAVLNDLTQEHILRERQNNLERARFWNELSSAISHQIRNPLVAISTFSQLLPERHKDEEFRDQFQKLVLQEVEQLNSMITQLDEYANPPTLNFTPINISTLLDDAAKKADNTKEELNHSGSITITCSDELPLVNVDSEVMAQSIARLLQNSYLATHEHKTPKISIRASCGEIGIDRPAVIIEVTDNGPGIPEELQPNVYSPFCTTKNSGVGLGLPIVRRTMIDHGGLIDIRSSSKGTTVRLTLPTTERQ